MRQERIELAVPDAPGSGAPQVVDRHTGKTILFTAAALGGGTLRIMGSLDGSNFAQIGADVTAPGFTDVDHPAARIRIDRVSGASSGETVSALGFDRRAGRARHVRTGGSASAPAPGPFQFTPQAGERNALVWTGLSYTYGDQGFPELSTVQPYSNEEARNPTSRQAATPAALFSLVSEVSREPLYVGTANQLARNWDQVRDWIIHDRAVGGSEINDHVGGSTNFNNQMGQVDDTITLVAPDSLVYRALCTSGFGFIEEVFNGEPWATFGPRFTGLLSSYRTQIQARTGQSFDFPHIFHQQGFWSFDAGVLDAEYALEQLALALSDPDHFMTGPAYQWDVGGDNTHLTNVAYRSFAMHFGEVVTQILVRGIDWLPLHAVSAEAGGSQVALTYHVPAVAYGRHGGGDQLVLDTTAYAWRESVAGAGAAHGFRYIEGANPPRAITDVNVSGNQVILDLDGAAAVGAEIGYADRGARHPAGPVGDLRDNWVNPTGVQAGLASAICNFGCVQRIPIA